MPQIIYETPTVIDSGLVGPNSAVLRGRVYTVKAPEVTPLDETTQAAAYRAANKDKTRQVNVWMDVQYGQAPVGDLRFAETVPHIYPAGSHDVSSIPSVAWQNDFGTMGDDGRPDLGLTNAGTSNWVKQGTQLREDCLTCKITSPVGASGAASIFFIHGGKWVYGWANAPHARSELYSADHGHAVCNVDYRLGTMGHNGHPDLMGSEPSVAYTDIKAALKWWFDNCAAFGCDPAKITIMGTSAGGAAVQMLLTDDETQGWFARAWADSGGGTGRYLDTADYGLDFKVRETALTGLAPALQAMPSSGYETIGLALNAEGYAWTMRHAAMPTQIAAQGDGRVVLKSDAVRKAVNGETLGMADTHWVQSDKDYPFKRDAYNTALEAAKAGKFRKPTVFSWAAYEIWDLLASDYPTVREALLALPLSALNYYASVIGYADYAAFLAAPWQPVGGLKTEPGSQFADAGSGDAESRAVLYTFAVFEFGARRAAMAMADTASATAWLIGNNFSANSIWPRHSQLMAQIFGMISWVVGGVQEFPDADPPGNYANNRMDGIFMYVMMSKVLANFVETGNPNVVYSYAGGFDLLDGGAIAPADGGSMSATVVPFDPAHPEIVNIAGKYYGDWTMNAGTFPTGSTNILDGLDLHKDVKMQSDTWRGDLFADAVARGA